MEEMTKGRGFLLALLDSGGASSSDGVDDVRVLVGKKMMMEMGARGKWKRTGKMRLKSCSSYQHLQGCLLWGCLGCCVSMMK
jgi:hypothetical protein